MSFSSKTKDELIAINIANNCCQRAALTGWLQTAGNFKMNNNKIVVEVVNENSKIVQWGYYFAARCFSITSNAKKIKPKTGKRIRYKVSFSGDELQTFLTTSGLISAQSANVDKMGNINMDILQQTCCQQSYLRGIFLGCGSISDPMKTYHLEFVCSDENVANDLLTLMNMLDLNAKMLSRKGSFVVYLKESDKIIDFLTHIGAHTATLEYQEVRVLREFRNGLNRQVNCETANIEKTVTASARQIESILYLQEHDSFASLNDDLHEIALLRIENPEATLSELGEMLSMPIGKSGVNHRLRKIEIIANKLREEQGD